MQKKREQEKRGEGRGELGKTKTNRKTVRDKENAAKKGSPSKISRQNGSTNKKEGGAAQRIGQPADDRNRS